MTSREGYRREFLRTGRAVRSCGNLDPSHAHKTQHTDTKANWTSVRVAGLSNAVRIDFDDVLVNADDQYHNTQRSYEADVSALEYRKTTQEHGTEYPTMSLYETGARSASAISWAFWLTLPDRMCWMALLMPLCFPKLAVADCGSAWAHLTRLSLRGCQRSAAPPLMLMLARCFPPWGLAFRPLAKPEVSRSGNFSVPPLSSPLASPYCLRLEWRLSDVARIAELEDVE